MRPSLTMLAAAYHRHVRRQRTNLSDVMTRIEQTRIRVGDEPTRPFRDARPIPLTRIVEILSESPSFSRAGSARRYTVDDIRNGLLSSALSALAELFLVNGDTHAGLYTGSKAMHTGIMHLLDTGKKKAPGA